MQGYCWLWSIFRALQYYALYLLHDPNLRICITCIHATGQHCSSKRFHSESGFARPCCALLGPLPTPSFFTSRLTSPLRFNLQVPKTCPNVDAKILMPNKTWPFAFKRYGMPRHFLSSNLHPPTIFVLLSNFSRFPFHGIYRIRLCSLGSIGFEVGPGRVWKDVCEAGWPIQGLVLTEAVFHPRKNLIMPRQQAADPGQSLQFTAFSPGEFQKVWGRVLWRHQGCRPTVRHWQSWQVNIFKLNSLPRSPNAQRALWHSKIQMSLFDVICIYLLLAFWLVYAIIMCQLYGFWTNLSQTDVWCL